MPNFNPAKHCNALNPYNLSPEEQQKVMDDVNNPGLSNPPGDYFRVELNNKNVDIPKLAVISEKTKDGKIKAVNTTVYIKKLLRNK